MNGISGSSRVGYLLTRDIPLSTREVPDQHGRDALLHPVFGKYIYGSLYARQCCGFDYCNITASPVQSIVLHNTVTLLNAAKFNNNTNLIKVSWWMPGLNPNMSEYEFEAYWWQKLNTFRSRKLTEMLASTK